MFNEIDVATGEVKCGKYPMVLKSNAIGSCVVVVAYDKCLKVGGLAHIMLSGVSPEKKYEQRFKYAKDAIEELYFQLKEFGCVEGNIELCMVGGANVLQREGDTIGEDNISSVEKYLGQYNSKLQKKAVGGILRRTVCLKLNEGEVYYTEGDSIQNLLYKFN